MLGRHHPSSGEQLPFTDRKPPLLTVTDRYFFVKMVSFAHRQLAVSIPAVLKDDKHQGILMFAVRLILDGAGTGKELQRMGLLLCFCLSVSVSVSVSVFLCLPVSLSVSLSLSISVCLSVCISFSVSLSLSVCLSVCLSACLSVCLFLCNIHLQLHA